MPTDEEKYTNYKRSLAVCTTRNLRAALNRQLSGYNGHWANWALQALRDEIAERENYLLTYRKTIVIKQKEAENV